MSSNLFPDDPHDPFQQIVHQQNTPIPSWPNETNAIPRWSLLTAEEQKEQTETIHKLEAKMSRLKSKSHHYYSQVDAAYLDDSHSDQEQEEEQEEEEEEEGLPLLWKTKPKLHKKSEHQYTKQSFFCCC